MRERSVSLGFTLAPLHPGSERMQPATDRQRAGWMAEKIAGMQVLRCQRFHRHLTACNVSCLRLTTLSGTDRKPQPRRSTCWHHVQDVCSTLQKHGNLHLLCECLCLNKMRWLVLLYNSIADLSSA